MNALVTFTPSQISLIRKTVAKDANQQEFDLFLEMMKARGLNPLLRHAFAQVYNKEPKLDKNGVPYPNQKERQLVIVISREGQRALAERTKSYRPDERAPRFDQDDAKKDAAINPAGLISAEVSVYKHSHGEWFPVTEVAYWEEAAPLVEIWEGPDNARKPTGKFELAKGKDSWRKMPRLMLAKVAEMAALRKAFPDDFSGLYGEAEMDRGEVLDLSPSEWADKADMEDRLAKIGGPDTYIIDWMDGSALEAVRGGVLHDKVMAFLEANREEPLAVAAFRDRNAVSLRQHWAIHKSDALHLKQEFEKIAAAPVEEEEAAPAEDRKRK